MLKCSVQTITPEKAERWLKKSNNWRTPKSGVVSRYAIDMKRNKWEANGESIKFNGDGTLIDGQHRLLACVAAEASFESVVVRGVMSPYNIDRGTTRTVGDLFKSKGEANYAALAGAVGWVFRARANNMLAHSYPKPDEALHLLNRNPGLREAVVLARTLKGLVSPSVCGALVYLMREKDKKLADWFFDKLATGEGLRTTDPVTILRNALIAKQRLTHRPAVLDFAAITIKCWNDLRTNTSHSIYSWKRFGETPEAFPEIV